MTPQKGREEKRKKEKEKGRERLLPMPVEEGLG